MTHHVPVCLGKSAIEFAGVGTGVDVEKSSRGKMSQSDLGGEALPDLPPPQEVSPGHPAPPAGGRANSYYGWCTQGYFTEKI